MFLMLKDNKVAEFDYDNRKFRVIRKELLPLGIRDNIDNDIDINLHYLYSWMSDMVMSSSRDNYDNIVDSVCKTELNGSYSRATEFIYNKGFNINTAYWISDYSGERYNKEIGSCLIDEALIGDRIGEYPDTVNIEITTQGSFRKAWVKEGDKLFLYKSDRSSNNINSVCEVIASDILDCFNKNIEHIRYELCEYRGLKVSKCENFINDNFSFIEAKEVKEYYGDKKFRVFAEHCGCGEIAILDYILFNTDRHMSNYGFMMDNNTGEIVSIAPLFEYNLALVGDILNIDCGKSISPMFYSRESIRELAYKYIDKVKLELNMSKFSIVCSNYKDYEDMLEKVLKRIKEMGIAEV